MIPILFIHWGNSDYLKYSIYQARKFNPDSRIILLGDELNSKYKTVEHYYINEFSNSTAEFEKVYQHLCFIDQYYVMFWFKRWFIIKDFLEKIDNISNFLIIDSDVLLYCNVSEAFQPFLKNKITIYKERGPHVTYMNDKSTIMEFCDYIIKLYTDENLFKKLLDKFEHHKVYKLPGGVDDMHALYEYSLAFPDNIGNTAIEKEGAIFDGTFSAEEGFEYDDKRNIKKIFWKDKLPYVKELKTNKLIRLNAIHFQGISKAYMHKYYVGKSLWLAKLYSEFFYKILIPAKKLYSKIR